MRPNRSDEINAAIISGDRNAIRDMVNLIDRRYADPSAPDAMGRTPLELATQYRCIPMICHLLQEGATIVRPEGAPPLECATVFDKWGTTALHHAAEYGFEEACDTLLAAGADVRAEDNNGCTPFYYAATEGRYEIFKAMLEKIDSKEERIAAMTVRRIPGKDCDPTILHAAAGANKIVDGGSCAEIISIIAGLGFDLNVSSEKGTALEYAVSRGKMEEAAELLRLGANFEASLLPLAIERSITAIDRRNAITYLRKHLAYKSAPVIKLFLEKGADPFLVRTKVLEEFLALLLLSSVNQKEIWQSALGIITLLTITGVIRSISEGEVATLQLKTRDGNIASNMPFFNTDSLFRGHLRLIEQIANDTRISLDQAADPEQKRTAAEKIIVFIYQDIDVRDAPDEFNTVRATVARFIATHGQADLLAAAYNNGCTAKVLPAMAIGLLEICPLDHLNKALAPLGSLSKHKAVTMQLQDLDARHARTFSAEILGYDPLPVTLLLKLIADSPQVAEMVLDRFGVKEFPPQLVGIVQRSAREAVTDTVTGPDLITEDEAPHFSEAEAERAEQLTNTVALAIKDMSDLHILTQQQRQKEAEREAHIHLIGSTLAATPEEQKEAMERAKEWIAVIEEALLEESPAEGRAGQAVEPSAEGVFGDNKLSRELIEKIKLRAKEMMEKSATITEDVTANIPAVAERIEDSENYMALAIQDIIDLDQIAQKQALKEREKQVHILMVNALVAGTEERERLMKRANEIIATIEGGLGAEGPPAAKIEEITPSAAKEREKGLVEKSPAANPKEAPGLVVRAIEPQAEDILYGRGELLKETAREFRRRTDFAGARAQATAEAQDTVNAAARKQLKARRAKNQPLVNSGSRNETSGSLEEVAPPAAKRQRNVGPSEGAEPGRAIGATSAAGVAQLETDISRS